MTQPACIQRRDLLKLGVGGVGLFSASCGWILYPERNGRRGGEVDLFVLLVDLLWLLPGLLPGAVCLAVDFATGCIYRSGYSAKAVPMKRLSLGERPATAEVTLDGAVVARSKGEPDREGRLELVWLDGVDPEAVRQRGALVLRQPRGDSARAPVLELL